MRSQRRPAAMRPGCPFVTQGSLGISSIWTRETGNAMTSVDLSVPRFRTPTSSARGVCASECVKAQESTGPGTGRARHISPESSPSTDRDEAIHGPRAHRRAGAGGVQMSHSAVFEQHINDLAGEPNAVPEGDPAAIGVPALLVVLRRSPSAWLGALLPGWDPPLARRRDGDVRRRGGRPGRAVGRRVRGREPRRAAGVPATG
jgi:hypothetical protein